MIAASPARGTHAARHRAACVALLATLSACSVPEPRLPGAADVAATSSVAPPDSAIRARPGYVVDSIHPPAEELRRFQQGLAAPAGFADAERSREALVRRFVARLAARDTAALRRMTLTRAEFAYLVYPGSAYTRPPYRTPPGLVWLQLSHATEKGLHRLMREDAPAGSYAGHACAGPPVDDGASRLWRGCRVRIASPAGDVTDARLFGVIVETGGRFKLASIETDL